MEAYLGLIAMFGFDFVPVSWLPCDGRLLSISANSALYSLLGNTYGGDGTTTFALPDLRGRVPVHYGQGEGLTNHPLGQKFGVERITLSVDQMPTHDHQATATSTLVAEAAAGSAQNPQGRMLAGAKIYADTDPADNRALADDSIATVVQVADTGAGQPFSTMQPILALNFCIAVQGIFPPRD